MLDLIENGQWDALGFFITTRVAVIVVCWAFMVLACLIDLWDARKTAMLVGEKLESHKYRNTIVKAGDYSRVLLFTLMFDCLGFLLPFYALPFATLICTVAILLIEGKSVLEHSAKKKSASANIPEVFRMIIKASSTKEAEAIINYLKNKDNDELDGPK